MDCFNFIFQKQNVCKATNKVKTCMYNFRSLALGFIVDFLSHKSIPIHFYHAVQSQKSTNDGPIDPLSVQSNREKQRVQ